jgi:hypothetical protein
MKPAVPCIALLTDFGTADPYVGIMKGIILSINPEARIVDVSHEIRPQAIIHGGFHLRSCVPFFPDGTIFVAVVDPGVGTKRRILYGESKRHRFLAPDNGLLSLLESEDRVRSLRSVTSRRFMRPEISNTFHGRDIFAPVAAWLSLGIDPTKLGPALRRMERLRDVGARRREDGTVAGQVAAIDRFGNLITNIESSDIRNPKTAVVSVHGERIKGIYKTYAGVKHWGLIAVIGSSGFLEIAWRNRSAAAHLGAEPGSLVFIIPPNVAPGRYATGDRVTLIETNFDTATGQEVGDLIDRLFERGALDVWSTPIQMKKSRPGVKLSVLVRQGAVPTAIEILRHSPTFGVRFQLVSRLILPREIKEVRTRFGVIRCKIGFMDDRPIRATPEHDDVAAAAREWGETYDTVHQAATEAGRRLLDK